jgi:hypothetical protein
MTISHLYSSVVVGTFAQIGIIFGEEFFKKITGLCVFIGTTCVVACQNGFFNSVLLSLNRLNFYHFLFFINLSSYIKKNKLDTSLLAILICTPKYSQEIKQSYFAY